MTIKAVIPNGCAAVPQTTSGSCGLGSMIVTTARLSRRAAATGDLRAQNGETPHTFGNHMTLSFDRCEKDHTPRVEGEASLA